MKNRLLQLDILRAIAIIMVLGSHTIGQKYAHYDIPLYFPHGFMAIWARCGWAGVDLFFVLSGFLVSGLLFSEFKKYGKVEVGRFLIRRGFKIYPAFYVFLGVTLTLNLYSRFVEGHSGLPGIGSYICEALFVQNYGMHVWPHTWSLAVEEHFYLLLGLGVFLLTRNASKKNANPYAFIPRFFLIVAPLVLIMRMINVHFHPPVLYNGGWRVNGILTHLRVDSLLFGVLLSYYSNFHADATAIIVNRYKWLILGVSSLFALTCIPLSMWSTYMYTVGFTVLYLGFGGLLMLMVHWDASRFKLNWLLRPLGLIGYYSYSIYLWHYAVNSWLPSLEKRISGTGEPLPVEYHTIVYIVGSLVVGMLMARIVEVPFLRLRDRLYPSRSTAAPREAVL